MPSWNLTLRLGDLVKGYHAGECGIDVLAVRVADRIRASRWKRIAFSPDELEEGLVELAKATSETEYREKFDTIYDMADEDRVWIETH